jgi:serine protease SohB
MEYGLFFSKITTLVVAFIIVVTLIVGASQKGKQSIDRGHLEITPLNEQFDHLKETMMFAMIDESLQKAEGKRLHKEKKKQKAMDRKAGKKS